MHLHCEQPRSAASCGPPLRWMHTGLAQSLRGLLPDPPRDLVGIGGGIDLPPAPRVLCRHLLVTGMHPLVEGHGFSIEPVLRAPRNPRQPCLRREVQQQREIGREAAGGFRLQPAQALKIQPSAVTLIGKGGITEAVAEHHFAPLQSRSDHVGHQLGPCGGEEQSLCPGRNPALLRPQEEWPDHLAYARTARLTRRPHNMALFGKCRREAMDLRRLPAALGSLKADEEPAWLPRGIHPFCVHYSEFSRPSYRCAVAGWALFRCCERSARGAQPAG